MIDISLKYHSGFIVLCLLVGALYAFILYYRQNRLDNTKLVWFLASLRTLVVSILCFLLLQPMLKLKLIEKKAPITIVALDQSGSMQNDSSIANAAFENQLNALMESLSSEGEVKLIGFDESVGKMDSMGFEGLYTNTAQLKSEVIKRFGDQNIGSLVILSDGINNKGKDPKYHLNDLTYPVYTIGFGDTMSYPDLMVANVYYNQLTYLGNEYPVEFEIATEKIAKGEAKLTLFKNDTMVFDSLLRIGRLDQKFTIKKRLLANRVGQDRIVIKIDGKDISERNYVNNTKSCFVDIIDSRQKILFVSGAVHPDEQFFLDAFVKNDNYEINYQSFKNLPKDISFYNLVVLSGVGQNPVEVKSLMEQIKSQNIGVLLMARNAADINLLEQLQVGLERKSLSDEPNQVFPRVNVDFQLFDVNDQWNQTLATAPPVHVPYGDYQFNQGTSLYQQKIGAVNTSLPLIHMTITNDQKMAFILGEGYWKWKMHQFVKNGNHQLYHDFLTQLVKLLSVKVEKSQFNLIYDRIVKSNKPMVINAEAYNEAFELINDPVIKIELTGPKGKSEYAFSKRIDAYTLNLGLLEPGIYQMKSTTTLNNEEVVKTGSFIVEKDDLEQLDLVANHSVLRAIANNNDGAFVLWKDRSQLSAVLGANDKMKTISYLKLTYQDLIHQKWIFFVLVGFLSLEWFLRKRNGAY